MCVNACVYVCVHIICNFTDSSSLQRMYLIMELCKGGELSKELKRRTYFKDEVNEITKSPEIKVHHLSIES